jgi:filamentous hemagglutinin family protein
MTNINYERSESFAAAGSGRRSAGRGGCSTDPRYWKRSVAAVAVASCFAAGVALANPVGPTVVAGQASFAHQGSQLTVTNSSNAIIHWQGFSIGPAELTRFLQPSASSAVLNRVVGGLPSDILGALQSNGRVFLINPSGIVFGAGARIDVAGLVASTLNITNEDFLSGRLRFAETPGAGSVVNQGAIRTAPRGNVYLIAPNVENSGVITSPQGEIILAAGRSVELVDVGTPDLRVQITAPDNQAVNLGSIVAQSGRIGIYAGLIHQKGAVNADTVVVGENGRVRFQAKDITLAAGSVTTASGAPGGVHDGGEVRIVADGALNMQTGAEVHVDGGVDGGNGGFLELSGKQHMALDGAYTGRARMAGYRGGTLLIDPTNVEFCNAGACVTGADLQVAPADINPSNFASVGFVADNDITVTSPILAADLRGAGGSGAGTELFLTALHNATINASILFDPDQRLSVEAGNSIATGNNALVRAGEIAFDATSGGITIGANTSVVANNPAFAHVGMLAGTVTGSDFASASGNSVDILGSVAALGQGINLVTIGGGRVTVADSGSVVAATTGSPTASQAAVVLAAMGSATGEFAQQNFVFPTLTNHGVGNSVLISGRVAASDPNFASVRILAGTVTINRGTGLTPTTPNIEANGAFNGNISIGALTQATDFSGGGFPLTTTSALDRALTVSGWLRSTAGASGFADVELQGGTATLLNGAKLDAIAQNADIHVAAVSAVSEVVGEVGSVTTATFVPGNRVQVDPGANLNALASGFGEIDLIGGSLNVAGNLQAFGSISGTMALAAAGNFVEIVPIAGAETIDFIHGPGHDVTVSGNLVVGAGSGGASGQLMMLGDRVTVSGGTQATPNISVSGPFGGVLAVAASTSNLTGSSLTASTHNDTTNVVDVSGWIGGAAELFTLDVVGGKVNVAAGGGLQASGAVAGEITVAAVGELTRVSTAPNTYRATQAPTHRATIAGTVTASGGSSIVSVIGGSLNVQGTGSVEAQGPGSKVALAAGGTSDFIGEPVFALTGLTATAANTLEVAGAVTSEGRVEIVGGAVTVAGSVGAGGGGSAGVNVAAMTSFLDNPSLGTVSMAHAPGSLVQVSGILSAVAASFNGWISVAGGSVGVSGTASADGPGGGIINVLAADASSFSLNGLLIDTFTAGTGNLANVSGTLNAGLAGGTSSEIQLLGGQVTFSGLAQAGGNRGGRILIGAASGLCSGAFCPSDPGMQVNVSGTATATGASFSQVVVSGDSINQTGGSLRAIGNAGAAVSLTTATGNLTVGGLVGADGGSSGEGIVSLQAGPSSGNITVTSTGSLQATDALGSGCPPICATVTVSAPAGSVTIDGSVAASNTGGSGGGASVDLSGQLGVTVNPGAMVLASSTAGGSGTAVVDIFGSSGAVINGTVQAHAAGTPGFATVLIFTEVNDITVGAPGAVSATGPDSADVVFGAGGSVTVAGQVMAGDPVTPASRATVILSGDNLTVLAGGEVEATATAGGLVFGSASGDITIGGNIYGGIAGGGVILNAGGAIIGAGGTLDGNVGDTISLTAANGIGAPGAPVRILDGQARVAAFNSGSGDLVLSQVTGDLFFGPAGNFNADAIGNAGPGGIEIIAETGNANVKGLIGNGSFVRVAAAGFMTSTGTIQNSVGSVFLQAAGGVTLRDATQSAQEDFVINGGPVTIEAGDRVSAGRNLVIAGTDITVREASLLFAGSNMGLTSLGNLTVEDSSVLGGNGTGLFTATVVGDFIIRGVSGLSEVRYFPDVGSPTLPVTIFGALRMEGSETAPAVLESVSAESVYLFFPLLTTGGVFVNGVEQTSAGLSGIFADGVPAELGVNLFISYGAGEVAPNIIAPLTGYINQATELAVPAGEQDGQTTGPGEEDDKKKKRPRNCS